MAPGKGEPIKKASVNNQGREEKSGRITFNDSQPKGTSKGGEQKGGSTSKKGK